jgi:hypothetical protein
MNKTTMIIAGTIVLAIGGYFVGNSLKNNEPTNSNDSALESSESVQPERKAEIYGKIKSIVGNEVVISKTDPTADPTINMTPEEKRAYMQGLDEAERVKLKEDALNATLGDVKVLINVGIPMTKKTAQGSDASTVDGSLADLKVAGVVSVWLDNSQTDRNVAEFVKITFTK